ncbi:hypothetical protein GCM10011366_20360 [Ornithinimicrobium tianjinense]|uniref:Alpha/beta hydrolase fold-3 domain-containing protein n=1 Tax=Ornithinimicrobium tianjinense TaxID=1195761 RepID=A0A917BS78_9MICO|nr:hypothetical protein GCM10011366_20360 [Ornithinimicrobium tianjinense]
MGLAVGATATAAGALALGRLVRRAADLRPAMGTVPAEFRSPVWYLLHRPYDPAPPRRGTLGERLAAGLARPGLGRPTTVPGTAGAAGAADVPVVVYDPPGRTAPSGALVWIHGGGMILGAAWVDHALCNRLATELGLLVVSVDYRLAPEHPFPAGPDDCYAALAWVHAHAQELGVDPGRVGVAGASAGGGLAATVAQMAHDRGLPLAFQGLVYPMLDDRTALRDDHGTRGAIAWTPEKNRDAWAWYLGHPVREDEARPYAAPARRADLAGLAPAWVGVGEADLFLDEDVDYARRLEAAGVPVELVTVPGMPHAADMVRGIRPAAAFRDSLVAAVGRGLAPRPS